VGLKRSGHQDQIDPCWFQTNPRGVEATGDTSGATTERFQTNPRGVEADCVNTRRRVEGPVSDEPSWGRSSVVQRNRETADDSAPEKPVFGGGEAVSHSQMSIVNTLFRESTQERLAIESTRF